MGRVGEINYNKHGKKMTIVKYEKAVSIIVKFENGYEVHTTYNHFKNGNVKSVYDKTVHKVGYLGFGRYSKIKNKRIYSVWNDMIKRCYDEKEHIRYPSYKECETSEEWHDFQKFARWYEENYYEIDNQVMHLDKDILKKGNKIYSKETCIFAPAIINTLFNLSNSNRGNLPIGVSIDNGRYRASCGINMKTKTIGKFDSKEEAFDSYKSFKEKLIREMAERYKEKIPSILYDSMISFNIEICD